MGTTKFLASDQHKVSLVEGLGKLVLCAEVWVPVVCLGWGGHGHFWSRGKLILALQMGPNIIIGNIFINGFRVVPIGEECRFWVDNYGIIFQGGMRIFGDMSEGNSMPKNCPGFFLFYK